MNLNWYNYTGASVFNTFTRHLKKWAVILATKSTSDLSCHRINFLLFFDSMFKAAVHSCHSLLCLICCSTWQRVKGEALWLFLFVSSLTVSLSLYCLIQERAGWLWWLREIEFQSVWLITVSNRGERCACSEAFLQLGNYLCAPGIRYLLETARRLPISDSYHFHSFAAGRLFCFTWTSLPFPHLSCTV